ncbi:Nif3-like dinuclear metal center hexameric protein, partial [Candidatus Poribacteria bacterium]|nr:Nif3-like dinuclear metal center hexameric protein [Candidatus Poribacteria bacterium]
FWVEIFSEEILKAHPSEWGITINSESPITVIAYATTLNPNIIKQATQIGANFIVTHHDAWDFMFEVREQSYALLFKHRLNHLWVHTPLDAADFGPSAALLLRLGCDLVESFAVEEALTLGRIGVLQTPRPFTEVKESLSRLLNESPVREYDCGSPIHKIGAVTGAGSFTTQLREAKSVSCNLYITGETSLYLLDYATHIGISVLIYSHNFTEIFGVESLAKQVANKAGISRVAQLDEMHY